MSLFIRLLKIGNINVSLYTSCDEWSNNDVINVNFLMVDLVGSFLLINLVRCHKYICPVFLSIHFLSHMNATGDVRILLMVGVQASFRKLGPSYNVNINIAALLLSFF